MDELLITFLFFIFIFSCHVVLHRLLYFRRIRSVHTIWCYAAGGILFLILANGGLLSYPLSAFVVYTLLSFGISILYMSLFLGAQTPAASIVSAFGIRKSQTMQSLVRLFHKKHLFEKRIENLLSFGFIKNHGIRYRITATGRCVALFIRWYQLLNNRPAGG